MKAIVQRRYGSAQTLKLENLPGPSSIEFKPPNPDQVLIRVKATSLNAPDWRLLRGKPWIMRLSTGLTKPNSLIRGTDLAGTIEGLGSEVRGFSVGDDVYADLADLGFGAWAEYVCVKADKLAIKPKNVSFTEAAALPLTAVTALQGVRDKAKVEKGERVLIVGAAGGVGSYALQHAKILGAHVTAVTSAKNAQQALSLGADAVIDYQKTPLDQCDERFDVILAINGYQPLSVYQRLLSAKGRFVMVGGANLNQVMGIALFGGMLSQKNGMTITALMARPSSKDLGHVRELVESGLLKPVIEREIAFEDIPRWIGELEKGHASGKIVATL